MAPAQRTAICCRGRCVVCCAAFGRESNWREECTGRCGLKLLAEHINLRIMICFYIFFPFLNRTFPEVKTPFKLQHQMIRRPPQSLFQSLRMTAVDGPLPGPDQHRLEFRQQGRGCWLSSSFWIDCERLQ